MPSKHALGKDTMNGSTTFFPTKAEMLNLLALKAKCVMGPVCGLD